MIYDKFKADPLWSELSEKYSNPGLTYRERMAISASMDTVENAIRRREKVKFLAAVSEYKDQPLVGEFYD